MFFIGSSIRRLLSALRRRWDGLNPRLRPYVVGGALLSITTLLGAEGWVYWVGPDFSLQTPFGPQGAGPLALGVRALVLAAYGLLVAYVAVLSTLLPTLRSVDWSTHPFPVALLLNIYRSPQLLSLFVWTSSYLFFLLVLVWGLLPAFLVDLVAFFSLLAYGLLYDHLCGPVEGLPLALGGYTTTFGRLLKNKALLGAAGTAAGLAVHEYDQSQQRQHELQLLQLEHEFQLQAKQLDNQAKQLDNERLLQQRGFFDWLWGRRSGGPPP